MNFFNQRGKFSRILVRDDANQPAGRTPDASWPGSMLPRSLTVRGDAGARHELPASHQPSAAGTVASLAPRAPAPSHKLLSLSHSTRHHRPRASSGSDAEFDADKDGAEPTASTSRCAQMAHVGRRGRTPNLYWLAPHDEQLRRHPRFVALPPVEDVVVGHESSYRYVRQHTELWDDLHAGRITTGCLTAALGFQEDGVCKTLGMGRGRGGDHGPLLGAYRRLRLGTMPTPSGMSRAEEERANAERTRAYNSGLDALGPAAPIDGGSDDDDGDDPIVAEDLAAGATTSGGVEGGGDGKTQKKNKNKKRRPKKRPKGAAPKRDASALVGDATPWAAARAMRCKMAARRGEGGVRMAWGSAQEAGTVATLMLHHPECVCEEVGLCCVDVDRWRDEWGLGATSVPPIGASPDAIVRFPTKDSGSGPGWERLVVEVKNHSPFRRDPGKPGVFYVNDRTPFETPPPYHVPQLQMEMLAADTNAGLLCMQSATRGVRVFRIERDDEYCAGMLRTLGAMHEEYVLRGREPPERMFSDRDWYFDLVRRTVKIAKGATLWEEIPYHARLPGEAYDERPFLPASG